MTSRAAQLREPPIEIVDRGRADIRSGAIPLHEGRQSAAFLSRQPKTGNGPGRFRGHTPSAGAQAAHIRQAVQRFLVIAGGQLVTGRTPGRANQLLAAIRIPASELNLIGSIPRINQCACQLLCFLGGQVQRGHLAAPIVWRRVLEVCGECRSIHLRPEPDQVQRVSMMTGTAPQRIQERPSRFPITPPDPSNVVWRLFGNLSSQISSNVAVLPIAPEAVRHQSVRTESGRVSQPVIEPRALSPRANPQKAGPRSRPQGGRRRIVAVRTAQFFGEAAALFDPSMFFVHLAGVVKEAVRGDRLPVEVFRLPHELQCCRSSLTPV